MPSALVTLTDWIFTAGGVVLILAGAYGMAAVAGLNLRGTIWLVWGQALLPGAVLHDKASVQFLDRPGRREAACGHWLTELRSPGRHFRGFRAGPTTLSWLCAACAQRRTAARFEAIPTETVVKRVSALDGPRAARRGFNAVDTLNHGLSLMLSVAQWRYGSAFSH